MADGAALAEAEQRSRPINRAWKQEPARRAIDAAFNAVANDEPERAAQVAIDLLRDDALIGALLEPLGEALRDDPWFQPALRASRDALRTGALLYDGAGASIAATVIDGLTLAAQPTPTTVVFPGRLSVTRYLRSGGARLSRWHAPAIAAAPTIDGAPRCEPLADVQLVDGATVALDGRTTGHVLRDAKDDVVSVTVTIRAGAAPYRCEYSVGDGRLLRAAAPDERVPRTQLLLQLLRVQGRADAGERFESATHDDSFDLRWTAMREWLALDTRAALPRLRAMAIDDPHPEVHAAARATVSHVEERLACRG